MAQGNPPTVPAPSDDESDQDTSGDVLAGEAKVCAIARIRAVRDSGHPVSALVGPAATALGVAPRTIWRWLDKGVPGSRSFSGWVPSEADVDAYLRWKGNASAAWRERAAVGTVPSLRRFQSVLAGRFELGDRAVMREGVEARRRHQVYLRWEPEARNELWETDHKELDVPVLFPRAQRPRKPWTTLFVDGYSRAVMGWAISEYPSSASVLAALGEAVRVDDRRGPFGGIPARLRPDGGLEFAAGALEQACGVLAIHLDPAPAYSPTLKGKVERLHGTIVESFLAELPHFADGPRDASGKLWGQGLPVLTVADLVGRFDAWVLAYNRERAHAGLGGRTPLERWQADATPLRTVPDQELRWTLLEERSRRVQKSGVRFHGLDFVAPELNGLVGETVAVRYRPHDDTSVDIFRSGGHLCTALPQGTLGAEERAAVLQRRREDAARQAALARRATRRARERFAPSTEPGEPSSVSLIAASAAETERAGHDSTKQNRAARTDLLGLPSAKAR